MSMRHRTSRYEYAKIISDPAAYIKVDPSPAASASERGGAEAIHEKQIHRRKIAHVENEETHSQSAQIDVNMSSKAAEKRANGDVDATQASKTSNNGSKTNAPKDKRGKSSAKLTPKRASSKIRKSTSSSPKKERKYEYFSDDGMSSSDDDSDEDDDPGADDDSSYSEEDKGKADDDDDNGSEDGMPGAKPVASESPKKGDKVMMISGHFKGMSGTIVDRLCSWYTLDEASGVTSCVGQRILKC